ncbi:MAG: hypothetical protein DWQ01_08705 [Planctomycetota bacterium]|nr:MAG: hypothetical protein DWQ01_08705 [Planctomycetota bacterium]
MATIPPKKFRERAISTPQARGPVDRPPFPLPDPDRPGDLSTWWAMVSGNTHYRKAIESARVNGAGGGGGEAALARGWRRTRGLGGAPACPLPGPLAALQGLTAIGSDWRVTLLSVAHGLSW